MSFLLVTLAALAAAALTMALAALRARQLNRIAVVDVAWGASFVVIAVVTLVLGLAGSPDELRRWMLPAMAGAWGLRLSWHIRRRAVAAGDHDDPRYLEMLGGSLDEVGMAHAVRKVFLVQGLAVWVISLPLQVGAVTSLAWWPIAVLGVVVWLVGLLFESVGDAQLAAYKADPDRGPIMDRGLWAWTRHPNYFGDACIWWGLWLTGALASGWVAGLATIIAPLAMTYFLVFATGARLLERSMMKREGYPAYAARTSMFLPAPPGSALARHL